jgi:hypothetical protein
MSGSTYTGTKGQVAGIGAVISIGAATGAGTETFVVIGEPTDAKFGGRKLGVIDATSFASGGAKRKLGSILDYGQLTVTSFRIPSDPGQVAVAAANVAAVAYDFTVQLPKDPHAGQVATGDLIAFSALVSDCNFDVALTKESEFSFTLDIDGAYVVTPGS